MSLFMYMDYRKELHDVYGEEIDLYAFVGYMDEHITRNEQSLFFLNIDIFFIKTELYNMIWIIGQSKYAKTEVYEKKI